MGHRAYRPQQGQRVSRREVSRGVEGDDRVAGVSVIIVPLGSQRFYWRREGKGNILVDFLKGVLEIEYRMYIGWMPGQKEHDRRMDLEVSVDSGLGQLLS